VRVCVQRGPRVRPAGRPRMSGHLSPAGRSRAAQDLEPGALCGPLTGRQPVAPTGRPSAGDPLSFDIFTQLSQALKVSVAPEALLPGLTVSNVITVGQFSAPACSWAVEKQTQRWMCMGRASRHGRAMMDQRNQVRRRKKSLDPTPALCRRPVCQPQGPPETFPLNPELPRTGQGTVMFLRNYNDDSLI
jgi:hypothetical protein